MRLTMRRLLCVWALVVMGLLAGASPASATTIGLFTYDVDSFFGPFFTVHNTSNLTTPGAFSNTTIELLDGVTTVYSKNLGTVAVGGAVQTTDNLDDGTFVFDAARLTLTFTPQAAPSIP